MKYKVFLDTNQLMNDSYGTLNDPFSNHVLSLRKFLKDNRKDGDVGICLPEIVIQERIQHKLEKIELAINSANEKIKALSDVGHRNKEIVKRKDYPSILARQVSEFMGAHGILRIPTPAVTTKLLLKRAISKTKPFSDNTAGFKDTLIYLSIVKDATESDTGVYIFCTNNSKDFDKTVTDDFLSQTGKQLIILPTITEAKEKLDEIIPMGLHLEQRNNKIHELIEKKLGTLCVAVNRTRKPNGPAFGVFDYAYKGIALRDTNAQREKDIVGYDYSDHEITSISEKTSSTFELEIKLSTSVRFKQDDSHDNSRFRSITEPWDVGMTFGQHIYNTYEPQKSFDLYVTCDLQEETVFVDSVGFGSKWGF